VEVGTTELTNRAFPTGVLVVIQLLQLVGSGYGFRCVVDFPKLNPEGKVWDGNWQPEPLPISPLSTSTWCPLPPNCASKRLKSCV